MKVVVIGPESTGSTFLARWLDQSHALEILHLSMPYGHPNLGERHWPDDPHRELDRWGPDRLVWTTRAWAPTARSTAQLYLEGDLRLAYANIREATLRLSAWIAAHDVDWYQMHYDAMCGFPRAIVGELFDWLGYPYCDPPEPIVNGNFARLR